MRIGILAYGSLIENPGDLQDIIAERRTGLRTPFRVEFARSSSKRGGAPTLVPVSKDGAYVEAVLLVLDETVNLNEAKDSLYRRETHASDAEERYEPKTKNSNQVWVEVIPEWGNLDAVLYTRINSNIADLSPDNLAFLAIESAKSREVEIGNDGISNLMNAKAAGIETPLSNDYEAAILTQTRSNSLKEALESVVEDSTTPDNG